MATPQKIQEPANKADVTALLAGVSLEAVLPSAAELHEAASALPTGTSIYLTDLPNRPADKIVEIATGIFMRGLKPVPHVAARNVASEKALAAMLERVVTAAGVKRIMLIGGDRDRSAGPFEHALDVIESGILQGSGITEIGLAGYPEGHPTISEAVLRASLRDKLNAAAKAGLTPHIVTQFAFEAWPVITWLQGLRRDGISNPVRIGMAGPASIPALMRFAQRCGVRVSARGFARHASSIGKLLNRATPADMIGDLAEAAANNGLGEIAAHFYSFGGLAVAANWVREAKGGKIE